METLPSELLLRVFSFVSSLELYRNVRLTCKYLHRLLSDQKIWLLRLQKEEKIRLSNSQMESEDFSAVRVCAEVDRERERWRRAVDGSFILVQGHLGVVDVVHFLRREERRICVSGSRDHSLCFWDMHILEENEQQSDNVNAKLYTIDEAHKGWIWSLASSSWHQSLFSCGWDHAVRHWQIRESAVDAVCSAELAASALSVITDDQLLFVSSFDRAVSIFDIRCRLAPLQRLIHHRRAVITVAHEGNCLFSGGEDGLLAFVDKRTWRSILTKELGENYAHSLSLGHGQLWAGVKSGCVRLFNPNDLSFVTEHKVDKSFSISQVQHGLGSMLCIVKERQLKVFTPGLQPKPLASFTFDAGPSRFDYWNGDLAVACGDGSVRFMMVS